MTEPEQRASTANAKISRKSVPACIKGGKHKYEGPGGTCILCGESPLAVIGWNRLRIKTCEELACGATISAFAAICPYCKEFQKPTLTARIANIYLSFVEPFRVFLLAPRPSGINFFEQIVLLLVTSLGVLLGETARASAENGGIDVGSPDVLISLAVALVVIPAVIKEKSFLDPKTPFINRIGLALQKGLASEAIVKGLEKQLL